MSKLSQSAFIWDSFILIEEKRLEKKVLSIYCSENSEKIVINQAMRDKAVCVCVRVWGSKYCTCWFG